MNRDVARLIRAHLASGGGAWLLATVIAQFFTTGAAWALWMQREPLPGIALAAIGAALTLSRQTLAWRALPISTREIALARWWAVAGVPGAALTATLVLVALDNPSMGLHAPAIGVIALQVAVLWSVLGVLAWLPPLPRWQRGAHGRTRFIISWGALALLAAYGYPLRQQTLVFVAGPLLLGLGLLLGSLLRALNAQPQAMAEPGGRHRDSKADVRETPVSRLRGWAQLAWPLFGRTVVMAIVCIGGVSALRWLYPRATDALTWVFLVAVSVWSGWATRRWLGTLWFWRCLPLSTTQLAIVLQVVALLPGTATLLLALAVHHLAPAASLPLPGWLIAAFVALQSAVDSQLRGRRARRPASRANQRWIAQSVRLTYPGYITVLLATMLVHAVVSSVAWLCAVGCTAALLLATNYYLVLLHLRSADAPEGLGGDRRSLKWQPHSAFRKGRDVEAQMPALPAPQSGYRG